MTATFLKTLTGHGMKTIRVGSYTDAPEPFMGPLISNAEVEKLLAAQESLVKAGGKIRVEMKRLDKKLPFVSPALIDTTEVKNASGRGMVRPPLAGGAREKYGRSHRGSKPYTIRAFCGYFYR